MFKDISLSLMATPSEADNVIPAFFSRLVSAPGVSAFHETIAKDFFKNHSSELKIHAQETLQGKREFSKNMLVSGEYEMKIECLHGKFEFTYEMFDRNEELFEKRRTNYHKKKTAEDRFLINVRDEHSPATLKVTIKDKQMFFSRSSRFKFRFQVTNVRHHLVKPAMWQVAEDVLLGEGGCASVYLGMNNLTGTLMAVKVANLGATGDPYLRKMKLQQLEEEIETMKILSHENIVRYLGMERKDNSIFIFMDFISGGSIEWILSQFTFSESLIQQHTKQVLKGLNYLHEREIIHRDIKCSNILYDEAGRIYLTDFGSSKKYTMDLINDKGIHGTPQFMAPEVYKSRTYSTKSDIWSLGCTIYQMLTGKDPWEEHMNKFQDNPLGFINYMSRKIDEPEIVICDISKMNISSELKDLLGRCFKKDPAKRPSVKQLLRHAWFDTIIPSTPSTPASFKGSKIPKEIFGDDETKEENNKNDDEKEEEGEDDETKKEKEEMEEDEEKKKEKEEEEEKKREEEEELKLKNEIMRMEEERKKHEIEQEKLKNEKEEEEKRKREVAEKQEREKEEKEEEEDQNSPVKNRPKNISTSSSKKLGSENWKAISKKGVKERILQMKTRGKKNEEEVEGEDED